MAEDERDEVPPSAPDARLGSLEERLKRAERVEGERVPKIVSAMTVRSRGMRVAQGLVGMPLGGALIGWLIDRLLDTAPWIMLALMFLGFAGAVWDAMKTFGQSGDKDAGN
jgi:ATP synthase protein I